ncbi:MAG TPA: DUF1028 domain-containing protein [Ignavibacteria bacterium]|nr:DUF1028 domain-containing protein [Ignavibacteria bacterium]
MKKFLLIPIIFIALFSNSHATFSIIAYDPVTGEIGSAGASCIAGSIILSDILPGIGGIHTQAYWNSANQQYARQLMLMGLSPQQIIDSLVAHDSQGDSTIRQYGIIKLNSTNSSAAYTGANCTVWRGHSTGPVFAIQGNILLGQHILDSMEARFNNTPGNISLKLMAALQGAKVPAADTRCAQWNKSSISAFIRVARLQDTTGTFWLNLNVNNTPASKDPIDSLQVLFNSWLLTSIEPVSSNIPSKVTLYQNYPNPFNPSTKIRFDIQTQGFTSLKIYDLLGREVSTLVAQELNPGSYEMNWDAGYLPGGAYFYSLTTNNQRITKTLTLIK